ncbi:hypothetical protein PQ610_06320 [Tardisphaera miroshnichenkoae]
MDLVDLGWLFAVSFLSNATPFFGASYTLIAVGMLYEFGVNPLNVAESIAITAIGASASKNVMYALGMGLRTPLSGNKNISLLKRFAERRSFYVTVFIFAFLPALPLDDYLYVGGGVAAASVPKVNGVALAGKLAKSAFEIPIELAGLAYLGGFTRRFGLSFIDLSAAFAVAFVIIGYVLLKVDWEGVLRRTGLAKRFFGTDGGSRRYGALSGGKSRR